MGNILTSTNGTRLSFERTAVISSCGDAMLDALEKSCLSISMSGAEILSISYEELSDYLKEGIADMDSECYIFIKETIENINRNCESVGEVVFIS